MNNRQNTRELFLIYTIIHSLINAFNILYFKSILKIINNRYCQIGNKFYQIIQIIYSQNWN